MNLLIIVVVPIVLIVLTIAQMLVANYFRSDATHQKSTLWQWSYYLSVTAVLATIFYAGFIAVAYVSRQSNITTNGLVILSTILALMFGLIANPFSKAIREILNQSILQRAHKRDDKEVIRHYSQVLSRSLDRQRLGQTVLNLMVETLGIERGVVFANEYDPAGNITLRPLASIGIVHVDPYQFDDSSVFMKHFQVNQGILKRNKIETQSEFHDLDDVEKEWLLGLNVEFFVPVLRQHHLIGVLAFGSQGTTYYEEDLELMTALAGQTALALDSAKLFEQLALINQEVGDLNEQIAGFDQNKTDFLSIASHELRTPLTQIHGYSKMILDLTEEELKDPAYIKMIIEGIVKGSERMKDVVDVMFDVSEADIGGMNLFLGPVKMGRVIDQAAQSLLPVFDERRIAFAKSGIDDLPIFAADGTRLVQAFENLIGNALKYTPDGGFVKVEGRLVAMNDAKASIEIIVSDTGIGIDSKYHEQIFDKFFRIGDVYTHSTSKTKFKGAGPGLGLTLVKGIAEAHTGSVWVESTGHDEKKCPGSKFFFEIPLTQAEWQDEEDIPKQSQIETRHWRRKDIMEDFQD
ncbi:GAF domain-containing sensor histidine kinase [Anaerolineales bacterium HSG25]|nr:GAF domain-containing sensor histidine kinase [Anaerolineales bacterium HSG25]